MRIGGLILSVVMMKAFVYSKTPVSVPLQELLKRWPRDCAEKNLKKYMAENLNPMVSCVSMLAHPLTDGTINTKRLIEIMCVAPGYTVYKKDDKDGEFWNLAATDSYDLMNDVMGTLSEDNQYKRVKVKPVTFLNEKDAHEAIASDIHKVLRRKGMSCDWYDNSHGMIDEFVYKTTLMWCAKCGCRTSGRRFDDKPICRSCKPLNRFEGTTTQTPKVIDLSKLSAPLSKAVFTKDSIVDDEYVTFQSPETLPFVKGCEGQDEEYTKDFLQNCKSAVFDIETVTVDETLKNQIPDEIVSIVISTNTGTTLEKLVMLTRKVPDEWKHILSEGDLIDTNELLCDLRKKDQKPLPSIRVLKCSDEKTLVENFVAFLKSYRPHFLVSFNGHGFDNKYLIRASVSNRTKETFHSALCHLTQIVKMQNKDPLRLVNPQQLMRPHGKYCKGMLPASVMEVAYDSFPSMISIDLFPIHDSSLADACKTKGVAGGKLEGVAHTDIPRLYYGRHIDFFKYAVLDVIVTTDLYWKDRFDAVELFLELEQLVSTPWNLSISGQKTMTAQTTAYIQFNSNGFVRKAFLRPKRLLANAVVVELARYFNDQTPPVLDETLQLITDFSNGHCKCNTLFKNLPKLDGGPLTEDTVNNILNCQLKCKKPTDPPYSTIDAAMLLFYLLRGDIDWRPFSHLLGEYRKLVHNDTKKMCHFEKFVLYLVRVRKCMSPYHECPNLLWKEYKESHKTDAGTMEYLKRFAKKNHKEIISAAQQSRQFPRKTTIHIDRVSNIIKEKIGYEGIKLKMLPYDGALIICPRSDINLVNPVCVFDFRSQYPNGMRVINLGIDTNVSLGKVMECIRLIKRNLKCSDLKEAARVLAEKYVHVCFTRRVDDTVDWTDYLDNPEYLNRNCIFFVRKVTSIQNHQFKAEIDSRVEDKFKAEDKSLTTEERKKYANRSTAKKVNINSRYGLIQSTVNPRFQATVTGVGRRSIQQVTDKLRRVLGTKEIYGDSVPGYTPVLLKNHLGSVVLTTFDRLKDEDWVYCKEDNKERCHVRGEYEILTHEGWKEVVKFVRHKTNKRIYRVTTHSCLVDVTEDHSLIEENGDLIKPSDLHDGMELLNTRGHIHGGITTGHDHTYLKEALELGCTTTVAKSQIAAQEYWLRLTELGYQVYITDAHDGLYKLTWSTEPLKQPNAVRRVLLLHESYDGYVYDVETEVGTFHVGVGDIVVKNTDSCFTYIADLNVFDMAKMSPESMFDKLKFGQFGVDYERFKTTIYDKYYPVDATLPRKIRESGGRVVQELYQVLAPLLSSNALELEAEKTLCPMTLPSMKKYTAYNCVTSKVLTKGLSLHNKSAIPMTKTVLESFNDICASCWDEYDLICSLYNYLGAHVTVPIELDLVDHNLIAKPSSISIKKVKNGSKQDSLLKSLAREGVCFIFEKIHVKQVTVYPEGADKDWSLCDIQNQSCAGRVHTIKVKFDVLKEILGILKAKYKKGSCMVVEALIWGEYYPDRYTQEDFRILDEDHPEEFKPMSFNQIISKKTVRCMSSTAGSNSFAPMGQEGFELSSFHKRKPHALSSGPPVKRMKMN